MYNFREQFSKTTRHKFCLEQEKRLLYVVLGPWLLDRNTCFQASMIKNEFIITTSNIIHLNPL